MPQVAPLDTPTSNQNNTRSNCLFFCFCLVLFGTLFCLVLFPLRPHAYIEVRLDSVGGLPNPGGNVSTFSPEFNLTLIISKKTDIRGKFCNVDGAVTVMYNGFSVAAGPAPTLYVKAGKEREASFQAWGREVALPSPVHDTLVEDSGSLMIVALKLVVQESSPYNRKLYHCDMYLNAPPSFGGPCRFISETMFPFAFETDGIQFKL